MLLKAKSLGDPDFANYPRMDGRTLWCLVCRALRAAARLRHHCTASTENGFDLGGWIEQVCKCSTVVSQA